MRKLALAMLLLLVAVATRSEAQNYAYQATTRFITTTGAHCGSTNTSCNVIGTGAAFHNLTWNVTGTLSACSVRVDSSADGVTWNAGDIIAAQTCTANGNILSSSLVANYVRVNVTTITPVGSANLTVNLIGFVTDPTGGGSGPVTAVTASSPLASSGGASPNITCVTCQSAISFTTKTGDYTATSGDNKKAFFLDGSAFTITLPATVPALGWQIILKVKPVPAISGPWVVDPNGHNIDGSPDPVNINAGSMVTIFSDGAGYQMYQGQTIDWSINGSQIDNHITNAIDLDTDSTSAMTLTDVGDGSVLMRVDDTKVPEKVTFVSAGRTTALTAQNINSIAGDRMVQVNVALSCTVASATSTAQMTVTFTDTSNTVQTISPDAADCSSLGSGSYAMVSSPINVKDGTNITLDVSITNTPTYDVRASVLQLAP